MREVYEEYFTINKGDVVVDLGAHYGYFSRNSSFKAGYSGIVIVIEPCDKNIEILEYNLRKFALKNYIIIRKGVWSRKDTLKRYLHSKDVNYSLVLPKEHYVTVTVDTLDNILETLSIEKVNFIKMDIEGAKIEVIKGAYKI